MATSRGDGIGRREKRGPSPANSSVASTQRRTKNSTSPSPGKLQANYLRPTAVSSRNEPSKNVKKPGSVSDQDTSPKATPLRRRSLDLPDPSAARATKSLISSGPKDNNKPKTMHSVSFSSKSRQPSPKPTVERTSKSTKAVTGKSHNLSSSSSMKKPATLSTTTKKDSVSKKAPSATSVIHDAKQEINVETKNEIDESPVHDVEEVEAPEIPQSHIEKELDGVNTEVKRGEEVDKDTIFDIGMVPEEQNLSQIDEEILYGEKSDPEDLLEGEENAKNDGVRQEDIETEAETKMEENAVDEKEGTIEEEEEEENNRVKIETEPETETEVENKEVDEGSQKLTEELDNSGAEEAKPEAAPVNVTSKLQTTAVQGKKESPTAYNNVIEETASKLLEKRKNKVKALVGAFETVIDYETASSK